MHNRPAVAGCGRGLIAPPAIGPGQAEQTSARFPFGRVDGKRGRGDQVGARRARPRRLWLLVLNDKDSGAPMSCQEGGNICGISPLSSQAVTISPLVSSQNLANQFIIKPRNDIVRHGTP